MPKGYWIAQVDVEDFESYKTYIAANAAPFKEFGGRFLVRGGAREVPEGAVRARTVVLKRRAFNLVHIPLRKSSSSIPAV